MLENNYRKEQPSSFLPPQLALLDMPDLSHRGKDLLHKSVVKTLSEIEDHDASVLWEVLFVLAGLHLALVLLSGCVLRLRGDLLHFR